ncbi:hypothetical protein QBC47DRAFT_174960 [Echria macrotheca]|uniref:BZIP domain-containing protein n=1 Tax=Echria macrotheca TaxID=438768 RepID=A0AAJ0BF24_9PEZI|nr:hypothetical protein QBC47DRAFT_174960 [Echria macrotheca]
MDQFGGWEFTLPPSQDTPIEPNDPGLFIQPAIDSHAIDEPTSDTQLAVTGSSWGVPMTAPPGIAGRPDPSYPISFDLYAGFSNHPSHIGPTDPTLEASFSSLGAAQAYIGGPEEQWSMVDLSCAADSAPSTSVGMGFAPADSPSSTSLKTTPRRKEVPILPAIKRPSETPTNVDHATDMSPQTIPKRKRGRPVLAVDDGALSQWKRSNASNASSEGAAEDASGGPAEADSSDGKRHELRVRNRAAATRYRNRIQALGDKLEVEERQVEAERQYLLACANQLRGEVLHLRNEVLQHSGCGCPVIENYLSNVSQESYVVPSASPNSWQDQGVSAVQSATMPPQDQEQILDEQSLDPGDERMS